MPAIASRYTTDEIVQIGRELYARTIQANIKPEDTGKFVALDIDSHNYEIDKDDLTAIDRLQAKYPNAQILLLRAGHEATCRFGYLRCS